MFNFSHIKCSPTYPRGIFYYTSGGSVSNPKLMPGDKILEMLSTDLLISDMTMSSYYNKLPMVITPAVLRVGYVNYDIVYYNVGGNPAYVTEIRSIIDFPNYSDYLDIITKYSGIVLYDSLVSYRHSTTERDSVTVYALLNGYFGCFRIPLCCEITQTPTVLI